MYNLVDIHGAEIDFVPQNLKNYILNEFNYTNYSQVVGSIDMALH